MYLCFGRCVNCASCLLWVHCIACTCLRTFLASSASVVCKKYAKALRYVNRNHWNQAFELGFRLSLIISVMRHFTEVVRKLMIIHFRSCLTPLWWQRWCQDNYKNEDTCNCTSRPVSESECYRARNGTSESERDFSRERATIHTSESRRAKFKTAQDFSRATPLSVFVCLSISLCDCIKTVQARISSAM